MFVHFTDPAVTQKKRELYTGEGENPHEWSILIHWNCVVVRKRPQAIHKVM